MPEGVQRAVLIIEDNPAALKLFRTTLEAAGYDVRVACDARRALLTIGSISETTGNF